MGLLGGDSFNECIRRIDGAVNGFVNDLGLSGVLKRSGVKDLCAYCHHLRTLLPDAYVCQYISAEACGDLNEVAVLVINEIQCIGGKSGIERLHGEGGYLTPDTGGRDNKNFRCVFPRKLCHCVGVSACTVVCKSCVFADDDFVGTVFAQLTDHVFIGRAENDRRKISAAVSLELSAFCEKLGHYIAKLAVIGFGINPYIFAHVKSSVR